MTSSTMTSPVRALGGGAGRALEFDEDRDRILVNLPPLVVLDGPDAAAREGADFAGVSRIDPKNSTEARCEPTVSNFLTGRTVLILKDR